MINNWLLKTFYVLGSALGAMKICEMNKTQFLPVNFETHLFISDRATIIIHKEDMVGRMIE